MPIAARALAGHPLPPAPTYLHQHARVHHVDEMQVLLGALQHVCDPQVQVPHPGVQLLRDTQHLQTKDGRVCREGGRAAPTLS